MSSTWRASHARHLPVIPHTHTHTHELYCTYRKRLPRSLVFSYLFFYYTQTHEEEEKKEDLIQHLTVYPCGRQQVWTAMKCHLMTNHHLSSLTLVLPPSLLSNVIIFNKNNQVRARRWRQDGTGSQNNNITILKCNVIHRVCERVWDFHLTNLLDGIFLSIKMMQ